MGSFYGVPPADVRVVWAPYRVCPLGAHIDHQLGTVTAMAIDRGVHLAFAPSGSSEVRVRSLTYPGEVRFAVDRVPPRQDADWGNYPRGAAFALGREVPLRRGILGLTSGNLAGVGLSSSASVGLAYLLALEEVNDLPRARSENIRLDQVIENDYLGLRNGILDQTAILESVRDHLTVIDCRAFDGSGEQASAQPVDPSAVRNRGKGEAGHPAACSVTRRLPKNPHVPEWAILIASSGLTKAVIATDYNRRVTECAEAAAILLRAAGRASASPRLGWVTPEEYRAHRSLLGRPMARRAEHFFTEMDRVRRGLDAWQQGDLASLGRLMRESGESSIRNYECGSPELIDLHEILNATPGIPGARFSGAGFRGCCVALAERRVAESVLPAIRREFAARRPELATRSEFFVCHSSDGAQIL